MKRIGALAIIVLLLSRRTQPQESVGQVTLRAVDATYTPVAASNRGILAFDLIVENDDDVLARIGCGMSIARKDTIGIKTVA